MMRVTLDTNAIIDLEEERGSAPALLELIALHRVGAIKLCVSAIAAGEKTRNGVGEPNFARFQARLAAIDLADAELLPPQCHWDITFWDHCIWAEEGELLEPALGAILFPNLEVFFKPVHGETDAARRKRVSRAQNRLCDVLAMWCHIRWGGHVFVTGDRNFHKQSKTPRLLELGAGQVLTPIKAAAFVHRRLDSPPTLPDASGAQSSAVPRR
jgi:hypothetical protein